MKPCLVLLILLVLTTELSCAKFRFGKFKNPFRTKRRQDPKPPSVASPGKTKPAGDSVSADGQHHGSSLRRVVVESVAGAAAETGVAMAMQKAFAAKPSQSDELDGRPTSPANKTSPRHVSVRKAKRGRTVLKSAATPAGPTGSGSASLLLTAVLVQCLRLAG